MSFWKQLPPKPTQSTSCDRAAGPTDAGPEKVGPDALVPPDGLGDLVNVGARGLADGTEGVDAGDALGQHGVGGQLGQLRGPQVGRDDAVAGDPVGVDLGQGLLRGPAGL